MNIENLGCAENTYKIVPSESGLRMIVDFDISKLNLDQAHALMRKLAIKIEQLKEEATGEFLIRKDIPKTVHQDN